MGISKITFVLTVIVIAAGCTTTDFPTGCGTRSVAIVAEPALVDSIRSELSQYEADLCTAGYNTVERTSGFANASDLRIYLQGLHAEAGRNLVGTLLIGNIPHAYQWATLITPSPELPDTLEEAISFQYYADLNGVAIKSYLQISLNRALIVPMLDSDTLTILEKCGL